MNQPIDDRYAMRFAENLRRLRMKTKMTGKQAAAAVGEAGYPIAWRTYYGWEDGTRTPPLDALPAIAKTMGVTIKTLFPND
jgi:transcriptional regulator with XRE-family HTH domain